MSYNLQQQALAFAKHIAASFANDHQVVASRRNEALQRLLDEGLPTNKMEHWRNSKIFEHLDKDFLFELPQQPAPENFCCNITNLDTNVVSLVNGFYADDNQLKITDEGIVVGSMRVAMQTYAHLFEKHFGTCRVNDRNGFTNINDALWQDGFFVYVPKNVHSDKPLQIIKIIDAGENAFVQTRNMVVLDENASLQIIDCDDTVHPQSCFCHSYTEFVVGDNARLETYKLQNVNDKSVFINTQATEMSAYANLQSHIVSFNGGLIRNDITVNMNGEGGETNIYGLYLMDKQQHVDNQLRVNHNVPNCNSNELFKGILDEEATAVFNGHVYVAPDAQKTNAYQNNKNLILTPTAKVNTMPFLEIYADDVKCSHGSAIGQLDANQLFYMRQRGISKANARTLLMYAFAAEVSNHIDIEAMRERVDNLIKRRLRGELTCCDTCVLRCSKPREYNFEIDETKI